MTGISRRASIQEFWPNSSVLLDVETQPTTMRAAIMIVVFWKLLDISTIADHRDWSWGLKSGP